MRREESIILFCENVKKLIRNKEWLEKSYHKSLRIDLDNLREEDYEVLETLCNRFGRTVDMLINKILRGLDLIELEDVSRKLDIVIRAEKRGFVDDYRILVALKDLRNELVHEYIEENLVKKYKEVIMRVPQLLDIVNKVIKYIEEKNYCKDPI
ncbi:MAG: hypothetical protein RRA63_09000 [Candidatus Calescibacterium sp.]|nr:hypothetical protein [Candidatus Calescibacterium sp.]